MFSDDDLALMSTELLDENNDGNHENGYDSDNDEENDELVAQDKNDSAYSTERILASKAFIYDTTFHKHVKKEYLDMKSALPLEEISGIIGIRIDTCWNKSSVMAYSQYKTYCLEF